MSEKEVNKELNSFEKGLDDEEIMTNIKQIYEDRVLDRRITDTISGITKIIKYNRKNNYTQFKEEK